MWKGSLKCIFLILMINPTNVVSILDGISDPNDFNPVMTVVSKLSKQSPNSVFKSLFEQPELIRHFGYPSEEHEVVTEDGYVLTLHRIPHGRQPSAFEKERPVVLLGHCLVGSSAIWTFGPIGNSLGYMLADAGKLIMS